MYSTEYEHNDEDDYVTELTHTDNQTAETFGHIPYHQFCVLLSDNQFTNNNTTSETVTIEVVNGLEVARGDDPTVLDYDGDVAFSVNGQQTTKTLTNGSVSFDLTTDKPAGSEIEIVAESLADHPAESDIATIEVVSQ